MLEQILENYNDETFLIIDGFNDCIIGLDEVSLKLIYSKSKIINKLIEQDGIDELEAIEYYEFNILGAYMGEKTPILCSDFKKKKQ